MATRDGDTRRAGVAPMQLLTGEQASSGGGKSCLSDSWREGWLGGAHPALTHAGGVRRAEVS